MEQNWKHKDTKNLVKYFLDILKDKAKAENKIKEYNKHISEIDTFLANRMVDESVDKLAIDGIEFKPIDEEQFSLDNEKTEYKIWDNPDFFEWLKKIGEDGLIKVKETVHPQTRTKFLKEMREQNIELPEWIKVAFYTHLKYNKSAVGRLVDNE